MAASSLMASQSIFLRTLLYSPPRRYIASIPPLPAPRNHLRRNPIPRVSASSSFLSRQFPPTRLSDDQKSIIPPADPEPEPLLAGPTRTIATLFALAIAISKVVAGKFLSLGIHRAVVYSAGPMFFAAAKGSVDASSLSTPFTVIAAGMGKWLDIYSGVLMVRVLLSWFPNIPWEKQPLSAIRDLCDPYLNLFRNIIPPIFDTLDVSPLLAFAVLGTLGSILTSTRKF